MGLLKLVKIKYSIFILLLFLFSCEFGQNGSRLLKSDGTRDLEQILADGKLIAVTEFNSTNYFIYKGEPMGFHFDLLKAFASHLGVKLEIIAENSLESAFKMVESGEVDVFANNLTIMTDRAERVQFSVPHSQTRQVLVQRKVDSNSGSFAVRNGVELGGKIIYVQQGSAAAIRLKNISEEIGVPIVVIEMNNYEADELIELVASGEIDFTVCDEDIAKVNSFHFANIDFEMAVSLEQNLAWALNKQSPELAAKLNKWLEGYLKTAEYRIIRNKYFENPFWAKRILGELTKIREGEISRFDEGFKLASSKISWDWRLFAALVYNESRFKHEATSNRGASGLMQFMPSTANYFGVSHNTDAQSQIQAGGRYLNWLEKRFEDSTITQDQRIKFVLASYNAGIGHVIDARNLARKYGKDPNVWDNNVDYFILNKTLYSQDAIVRHGKLKGVETYTYVTKVFDTYNHYKNIVPE
jgi:membrane-bound lytic murein transglycosylase F